MARGRTTSQAQKDALLDGLREGLTVVRACARGKMAFGTAYALRREDEAFRAAWDAAVREGEEAMVARLESEADRRAEEGVLEPIFHEGVHVGSRVRYSDTLLIFRLKAMRPQRYRDNQAVEVSGPGGGPVKLVWGDGSV